MSPLLLFVFSDTMPLIHLKPGSSFSPGFLSSNSCRSGVLPQPRISFRLNRKVSGVRSYSVKFSSTSGAVKDVTGDVQCIEAHNKRLEDRIRQQLVATKPSPSAYDTAWVAMVPAAGCPQAPRFPQCVEWILQNQHSDGSWGFGRLHPSLAMDALSSTMACVLALNKWGVGDEHIKKGLRYIGEHTSSFITDDVSCATPVGFNIIFPGMLALGIEMGLELPLSKAEVDGLLRLRDVEFTRNSDSNMTSGRKTFMAYVAEGLGDLLDWDQVMPFQRKNGSFFNSPSTTAAVAIHNYDDRAIDYLDKLVSKFGSSVPTVYPLDVYSQLCLVDTMEKMGISHTFSSEINNILDMAHRSWLRKDEEIVLDIATSAMAFRLLRMNGYDVSSDGLAQFTEESSFNDSIQGYLNDTNTLMELYKASQVQTMEEEFILEKIGSWSKKLLKEQLLSNTVSGSVDPDEVEYTLKYPFYTTLERLEHKRNIENFKTDGCFHMLKSAYCLPVIEDIVELAIDLFYSSQSLFQEELQHVNSWIKQTRLDELKFARLMPELIHFSGAATMFTPELSEARLSWSKNCVLTTIMDDFFDIEATTEELENFVTLIEKWDRHSEIGFCSEYVEILFLAIYNTCKELGEKAAALHRRSVDRHIAELWLDLARTMMVEDEWRRNSYVPSMEEYMQVAEVSFAQGPIVLATLYFMGPELTEDMIRDPEYNELFRRLNICGRLLNDTQTVEKEALHGKINSVTLLAGPNGPSASAIEAAKAQMWKTIEASRKELLRLLVRKAGSVVPRPTKQLFWSECKGLHFFYWDKDGYFSPEDLMEAVNSVLYEPLQVSGTSGRVQAHLCKKLGNRE